MHQPLNRFLGSVMVIGGLAISAASMAAPQGLYSADELLDADVYLKGGDQQQIGEVEDILLGENMGVQALVIDTEDDDQLDDRQYVIEKGHFTVQTMNDNNLDELEYRVTVDMDEAQVAQQAQYTNDWWQGAKQDAARAWQNTRTGASSAWQDTREATSNLLKKAGNAIDTDNQQ